MSNHAALIYAAEYVPYEMQPITDDVLIFGNERWA